MKRPLPTIDQEAFSSLYLTQKLTRSGITNVDKHDSPLRSGQGPSLCDGSRYGGVSHAPLLGDRSGTWAIDRALSPLATRSRGTRRCRSVNLGLRPVTPQRSS